MIIRDDGVTKGGERKKKEKVETSHSSIQEVDSAVRACMDIWLLVPSYPDRLRCERGAKAARGGEQLREVVVVEAVLAIFFFFFVIFFC